MKINIDIDSANGIYTLSYDYNEWRLSNDVGDEMPMPEKLLGEYLDKLFKENF